MTVFQFNSYEDVFKAMLDVHKNDRGYRSKLAAAAGVHPSYITRISQGSAAITPDQAVALAEFWQFLPQEKEFFLWLVLNGRSGEHTMLKLASENLAKLRAAHDQLGNALPGEKINPNEENEYYMNWMYSAVHMLATLKAGMTAEQMAQRLGVPEATTKAAIQLLTKIGLIEPHKGKAVRASKKNIHLSNESWMASIQHRNWRIASADRIARPGTQDVRYTGVHSISRKDLDHLRRKIRDFLIQTDHLVRPSDEETVCVLCLDLLEL